ncbi:MAG TPA: hypothetical protein VKB50_08455 [Vicinamibacterales bacterium]|nr:hypothetical protein [Vicinamibacterales bacterium]
MTLLLFGVLGFALGYRLGMSRRGFVTLAIVSIGASIAQVGHLLTTTERSAMTMLPLVVGTVIVSTMLLGALVRRPSLPSRTA